ncbi:class I SAM-dependent methyltransferase [Catellatospora sp. NPDC049111]|uniref:class I SAM-dependent methyltransferase n=1 Tax=Catellatospora sp. NPDC049111 TaxID=3155271 RepID=UPI00340BC8A7
MDLTLPGSTPSDRCDPSFEVLLAAAQAAPLHGWDLSWLRDRIEEQPLPWSFGELARKAIDDAESLLDIDTGGGENLARLQPLPARTVATEAWEPNVAPAVARLRPLGVDVRVHRHGDRLPAADGEFDVVLNRHGHFDPAELWRVLRPGGLFLTQQVGADNDLALNEALGAPAVAHPRALTLDTAVSALRRVGFEVVDGRDARPTMLFRDIAAVVYQLRAVPWQIADFDVDRYDRQLRNLHRYIREHGAFTAHHHRLLVVARKHP